MTMRSHAWAIIPIFRLVVALCSATIARGTVYYADPGGPNDADLYVDIPNPIGNIRAVYIVGKRGDMDTAFWGPRTNAWQPFLNACGVVMAYRVQGQAHCADENEVPQRTMDALTNIAAQAGHPELAHAPVFVFGFSGDARNPAAMQEIYPQRTLGVIWHSSYGICQYDTAVAPTNDIYYTPTMEISGSLDGFGWYMPYLLNPASYGHTGQMAWVAVQQGAGHGSNMDRTTVQFPWLLSILAQRLPGDTTPYAQVPSLGRMSTNHLWWGDQGDIMYFTNGTFTVGSYGIWPMTSAPPASVSSFPGRSALPDEAFARVWQAYCDRTNNAVTPSGNDAALAIQTVALLPVEVNGDEESGQKLRFTVVRSRVSASPLNVGFSLSGTASNGIDYALITNFTCTIPSLAWSGSIEVEPLDDFVAEGEESVVVTLTPNTNSYFTHSPAFINAAIRDDETAAPVILAMQPTNNAHAFIGTNLTLTFSRPMAKGTGTIIVTNLTDHTMAFSADASASSITASGVTVTIALPDYLAGPKSYAVLIASNALKDTQNHPFAGIANTTTWHFGTMQYDTNAPLLTSAWPTNHATLFNRFEDLQLTFNESVQAGAGMIVISNLTLGRNVEQIPVADTTRVFFNGSNVAIRPTNPLAQTNQFCVRLEPGVIVDLFPPAPNGFAGFTNTTSWQFTTKADPGAFTETFDNENATSDPLFNNNQYGAFGGVSNVQYSWYKMFSATGSNCQLIDGNGIVIETPVGGASQITTELLPNIAALSYQLRQAVLAETPGSENRTRVYAITRNCVTNQLKQFDYDYLVVPNVATVSDMNLVPINEPVRIQIIKTLDNLALTMDNLAWTPYLPTDTNAPSATFLPGTGAIELPVEQPFLIRFDEDFTAADGSPMNSALATAALYLTNRLTGAAVPFSAVYDYELGLPQITVTPDAELDRYTTYELGVKAKTLRDLAGNTNTLGARALLTTVPLGRYFRESFQNQNASTDTTPANWTDGSFIGDEGFAWNYTAAGSSEYASGTYRLREKGLVLRSAANGGQLSAAGVPGGVGSFLILFRNGDAAAGARKLALTVGSQRYESSAADSKDATLFRVDGINDEGDVNTYNTITISNASAYQVTVDSIVWTPYTPPHKLVASTSSLAVAEGGSTSLTITLSRYPTAPLTVTVQRVSGATNLTFSPTTFLLTEDTWASGIPVTLSSPEDGNISSESATFAFTADGVVETNVTVSQLDNDCGPQLVSTNLLVREGSSNQLPIRLTSQPLSDTTVSVVRASGDTDLTVEGSATLVFTPANWASEQSVWVQAATDADSYDSLAIFHVSNPGVDPVSVQAQERDAAWTNWVAFHDMSTNAVGDAACVSKGFGNGVPYQLVNSATTQVVTNVTLNFRYYDKNGVEKPTSVSQSATGIASPANGTHAANLFTNYVKPDVVYQMALTSDYAIVTIDGLSPDRAYGIGLFINRGNFTPRTRFILQNATNFNGAGTPGIGDCGDSDPATYEVEINNTTRGYVAMWTNITPTGNGGTSFSVRQDNFPGSTGTVLRLAQAIWITGEEPPTNVAPPASHLLTVLSSPGGSVSPTGGTYLAGSMAPISATASSYYHFVQWTGDYSGVSADAEVPMNNDQTVWAVFAESQSSNGTPHWWLAQNGFPASDAGALQTGANGMAAWESFIAGVSPNTPTSVFAVARFALQGNAPVLTWNSISGRNYDLLWSAAITGPYTTTVADTLATGGFTDTVRGASAQGFYQLRVRVAP